MAWLATQTWFQIVGSFVIGMALGAWANWLAERYDRSRRRKRPAPTEGEGK